MLINGDNVTIRYDGKKIAATKSPKCAAQNHFKTIPPAAKSQMKTQVTYSG